jgi:hypothetical protein
MSLKLVSVSYGELSDAFEFVSSGGQFENQAYICINTGTIYFVSSIADLDEEVPDDVETSDNYINVPHKNDLDLGRNLVFAFVEKELPTQLDTLENIFRRKGAYGRFKHMLQSYGLVDKWYEFEASAVNRALREWCRDSGSHVTDT